MQPLKKFWIISTTAWLTACDLTGTSVKPDTVVTERQIVKEQTATPVPCVTRDKLPPVPGATLTPEQRATAAPEQRAAAAERDLRRAAAYVREAAKRLEQCVSELEGKAP